MFLEDPSFEIDHEKWFIFSVVGIFDNGVNTGEMYMNNSLVY